MKKLFLSSLAFAFLFSAAQAQKGKFNFGDPKENFYVTQKRMNAHYRKHEKEMLEERRKIAQGKMKPGSEEEVELAGYELYKRWESWIAPRVYPSGDKTLASRAYQEYQNYLNDMSIQRGQLPSVMSATWTPLGPFGDPTGGNAGRINAVRFDPASSTGLWVCTPDGGTWKSTNNGTNWTTNTDQLAVIGNSDIVFDPTNSQIAYLSTGDGDAWDSFSTGVLKTTDGGSTWSPTGLSFTVSQGVHIYKLLINPQNKNVLFAGTTTGIYRTTNGGTSWNLVNSSYIFDMEYKPGDTTTVYATSFDTFIRSTNGGVSFATVSSGLPASGTTDRLAIAVTPANPAYVYVLGSDASNDGYYGLYQSTNSGTSFTKQSGTPNLLGYSNTGNDSGGQGWYTLSVAASPTNANEVIVGGVNIWRSTNGGVNWTINAHWTATGAPYVHADVHDLIYKNGTTVYAGTDGGIFSTSNNGTSWSAVNGAMNIAEIYKIGLSASNPNLAITGHQDNGTNLYTGGWSNTMGGDGMDCFIDWNNNSVMYAEYYNGDLNRTTNGGGSWTGITSGLTGSGAWVTPWHQDPITANTIYCGYQEMFKSTNQGTSWTQMGTIGNGNTITEFAVAPSNSQVLYVIAGTNLYKTTNGGTNWTDVTGTLPTGSAQMTWVAVENDDPNSVWVVFSGYASGTKVYMSTNGGTSWTNYSTGLPNLPVNCITYWNGTKDGLYVGCDVGIYYRDSTMTGWASYSTGLPNVAVRDIAIYYPTAKLRAATFGRGVWEADLYNNGAQPPVANFVADKTTVCAGMTVTFTDQSAFAPTSWSWTFQGGTPGTSSQQNPQVVYNTPGTYSVVLTATNANGSNSMTKTTYITVSPVSSPPLVEGFQGAAFPPTNWENYDGGQDNLVWTHSTTVGKNSTASMLYDNYDLNSAGQKDEMRTPKYDLSTYVTAKVYFDVAYAPYDATYSDTLALMVSTDCGVSWTQAYLKGGTTLATAPTKTASVFVPTSTQWRTDTVSLTSYAGMSNVMVAFQNRGYYGQALYIDNVNITGTQGSTGLAEVKPVDISVYPNPNNGNFVLDIPRGFNNSFQVEVRNALGQLVYSEKIVTYGQNIRKNISLSGVSNGLYSLIISNESGKLAQKIIVE